MSEVLLVRHAETDLKGRFCGHTDPGLNEAGNAQLPGIVERIGDRRIAAVISSDLRRAQETAAPIAEKFQTRHLLRPGLREYYFGEWEGLTWQRVEARDPVFAHRWHEGFPDIPVPGGELMADFEKRVADELRYLRNLAEDGTAVAVTHDGVIRAMLKVDGADRRDMWKRKISYGEIIWYSHE